MTNHAERGLEPRFFWQTTRFQLDLGRPLVMGVVNLTPDSFSDGGCYPTPQAALRQCETLLEQGADILDLGAESTRPGATPLPVADELGRLLPVVTEALKLGVAISVDSYKPAVMQAMLDLGVDIINDVWALRWNQPMNQGQASPVPSAQQLIALHPRCGVCLMHMQGEPQTMQQTPMEGDALPQVTTFLRNAVQALQALGVDKNRIVLDPGIGFGKTAAQNFALLARQSELLALGYPLLAGWSRKSSLAGLNRGEAGGRAMPVLSSSERLVPSVAAALLAVERGAHIVRVHDVRETVQALAVLRALESSVPFQTLQTKSTS